MKIKKLILLFLVAAAALSFFAYQKVTAATAPALKEGTYLTGQTLSVWPSWSLLGNTLGVALPTDPINQLALAGTCVTSTNRFCLNDNDCKPPFTAANERCVLHDPETGWSVADRRFSFACSRDSYAYRYIVSTTPGVYTVRARFEDTGIPFANFNSFVSSFISTTIFKISDSSGVCNFDQEISTMQAGVCGDGKLNLNKGEQCDPPGRIEYAIGCSGSIKNLTVCNSGCQWVASTTLCSSLSKCGNGAIEAGETCDDGAFLNGKYNHCNATCNGVSALGKCGDASLQSAYEICDPSTGPGYVAGTEKYSLTSRNDSCSWDCQNWGPYCGDALTQTQHGEECDGSQTCSIDGNPGTKVCAGNCQKKDKDAVAWWRFEKLWNPGGVFYRTDDSSVNANHATCNNIAGACPVVGAGKYGNGLVFGTALGNPQYLNKFTNPTLKITNSLTVEAWINPIDNPALYQRILQKGDANGYDLEINISAATHTARFNLWKDGSQTSVDSNSAIAIGVWTHVVGTYQRNGASNIAKIYVNGVLENTNTVDSATSIMGKDTEDFAIGKEATANANFFYGSMDEVKIYNRALSAAEVQNNYQSGWFCEVTSTPTSVVVPGSCGDAVIGEDEACDRGLANNGKSCVPGYGAPCSYCSADCRNTIDVQPVQYCGNGIVENPERCEVSGGAVYSATANPASTFMSLNAFTNGYQELACMAETPAPHTIKKGTKTCADCSAGVVRNCVQCGPDKNGVSVEGGLINVLDNPIIASGFSRTPDPLFAKNTNNSALNLVIGGSCGLQYDSSGRAQPTVIDPCNISTPNSFTVANAVKNRASSDFLSYNLRNPYIAGSPAALINSDPICSTDENPNYKYKMYINYDWTRPLNFPVVAEPQTWQYDMVLSPVVSRSLRPNDLRVVASWVGSGDFYSGVLNPFAAAPASLEIEGPSYAHPSVPGSVFYFDYEYATGINYYDLTTFGDLVYKKSGIWYHGFDSTSGQTSVEAFTIDTAAMESNTYAFYVRSPSFPIRQFKNTARLKVDIYLPENDTNQYNFGTPIKTYYFNAATPLDNQNARYWQVFNINKPSAALSAADIIDVNAIVTGPASFIYFTPPSASTPIFTLVVPPCTDADWTSSLSPTPCPSSGTQTRTWTQIGTCVGGVTHPATETVSCSYAAPALSVLCTAFPTSINTGGSATWTAVPTGGAGSYTYSWSGTDSLAGTNPSVSWAYPMAGTKTASVNVISGAQSVSQACSNSVTVTTAIPPLSVSCSGSPSAITTVQSATWTAVPTGGTGSYTYSWSGMDGLSGTNPSVSWVYPTAGIKTATVNVISGAQSVTQACGNSVSVTTAATIPSPPQNLRATAGTGFITIAWDPPASNGGSPLESYVIYRGINSFDMIQHSWVFASQLTFSDTEIGGSTFYYAVRAKNAVGQSKDSNIIKESALK